MIAATHFASVVQNPGTLLLVVIYFENGGKNVSMIQKMPIGLCKSQILYAMQTKELLKVTLQFTLLFILRSNNFHKSGLIQKAVQNVIRVSRKMVGAII